MSFETKKEVTGLEKELVDINYHDIRELLDSKGLQQVKSVGRKKKDIIVEALAKYDEVMKLQSEGVLQEDITKQLQEKEDKLKEDKKMEADNKQVEDNKIEEVMKSELEIQFTSEDGKLDSTALEVAISKSKKMIKHHTHNKSKKMGAIVRRNELQDLLKKSSK